MGAASTTALPGWVERGVLIYGPRKAGTTLFQNLLDGGGEVFVYPAELKLKRFAGRPWRLTGPGDYVARSRIPQVRSPHLSQERYRALWDRFCAEAGGTDDLGMLVRHDVWAAWRSCGDTPPPGMWCAKEVGGRTDAIIGAWREMFPGGKVLMITRNPLMVARAVLRDRRRQGRRLTLREIKDETLDAIRVLEAQRRLAPAEGALTVAYEELVADTAAVMRRVAAFLGVPYEPVFTRPTLLSEPVVVETSSRDTAAVFAPDAGWTGDLTPRECAAIAGTWTAARLVPALRRRRAGPSPPAERPL